MEKQENRLLRNLNLMITAAMMDKEGLALFEGRPPRTTVINKDDINNLKIVLHTEEDLKEILRQI